MSKLTDAEKYSKYADHNARYNLASFLSSFQDGITRGTLALLDLAKIEIRWKEMMEIAYLAKKMDEHPMISFDIVQNKFQVGIHMFVNLDDAIKATQMKALL